MKITEYIYLLLITIVFGIRLDAQTVKGQLLNSKTQSLRLDGFNGLNTYPISQTTSDTSGNFVLSYSSSDYGMGVVMSSDEKPLFVILNGEDIQLHGEAMSNLATIYISKGEENKWFEQYAREHPRREQALIAWSYLEKLYNQDSLFAVHETQVQSIHQEKERIKNEDDMFLDNLPDDSYVRWYLSTRKLVSSVSTISRYLPDEIPFAINAFRKLDYTDPRLYKSGLFKEAIENHFWLVENSVGSLDSVYIEMQKSVDAMMYHLVKDEQILNEVTDYLFDLLERHSLFRASEYLALKVLNEVHCTIDSDLAKQLETYRVMKKGNIAPDIMLDQNIKAPGYSSKSIPMWLSDLGTDYSFVVFGASWCPKCTDELLKISENYQKWKEQGIEVVFISLDESQETYKSFVRQFPFISICDFKKWESRIAQDYHVFATPTMYLLDSERKIILRPNSAKQMDEWVHWYLTQKNK